MASIKSEDWNILLITSDSHNAKIMGCAGHPVIQTPAIDRLAKEGMMFTHAYCADPVCAPTRQSMVTGRYPQEHGQFTNNHIFDARNQNWSHHFKKFGYTTALFGKMHSNSDHFMHGFDYKVNIYDHELRETGRYIGGEPYDDPEDCGVFDSIPDLRLNAKVITHPLQLADGTVLQETVKFLQENKDKKFFLHCSFDKPHAPWNAPNAFYHKYDPEGVDLPANMEADLTDHGIAQRKSQSCRWNELSEKQVRLCRARYYGCVSWLDHNVGVILDLLDKMKLTDKTLVIYSSDHGEMAGEKGLWFKKVMYDSSARVPLIMRMPGVLPAGSVSDVLINHVDYFPTLAGLVGVTEGLPQNISGKDLAKAILGECTGPEYTFCVDDIYSWDEMPHQVMVRSSTWKFIYYAKEDAIHKYALYAMEKDPNEMHNVAYDVENKERIHHFEQLLKSFLLRLKKPDFAERTIEKVRKNRFRMQ